jgi:hypothetical protein
MSGGTGVGGPGVGGFGGAGGAGGDLVPAVQALLLRRSLHPLFM